jgi:dipeptidyl aminopeptidase/acylaminoacyl peptidase
MTVDKSLPSLQDLINLDIPTDVKISPDGRKVAASIRQTNWKENRYEAICWAYDVEKGTSFPINRTGSVQQVEWVNENSLAILKNGFGENEKPQIWFYDHLIGEGLQVTDHENGVEQFKPYSNGFLYLANDADRAKKKDRVEKFGKFTYFEKEESASALYYVGLAEWIDYQQQVRMADEEEAKKLVKPVIELSKLLPYSLKIENIVLAAGKEQIYLNCRSGDDLVHMRETSSFQLDFDAPTALAEFIQREKDKQAEEKKDAQDEDADQKKDYLGKITQLHLPKQARITTISPQADQLLISYQGRDQKMFTQSDLWVIATDEAIAAADEGEFLRSLKILTESLDRQIIFVNWKSSDIFVGYVDHQVMKIARYEDGQFTELEFGGIFPFSEMDIAKPGQITMVATNDVCFPEVYLVEEHENGDSWQTRQLSHFGENIDDWNLGTLETIRWTSKDGTEIEGVLRKPANFDPAKKYPLALVVHGGPRWVSPQYLLTRADMAYYPTVQLVNKDVLILSPNYRGSLGRGQAFSELNKDNLGVGDLWDLESAIDYLDQKGIVDTERVGCMGWSQGGYISAFACTHSDKFTAVSVGAGISDWYTYHISNDIPDFTVDYLSGSPFRDRKLYDLTAPIKKLSEKSAPALIQHGSDDHRVPLSNAMELYRGLQEMGVRTELFIFPGMGHPITKPRENQAVMHQNLVWFSHYLLGEELKLF